MASNHWRALLRRLGAWYQRRRAARLATRRDGLLRAVVTRCRICGEITEFGGTLCISCQSQTRPD